MPMCVCAYIFIYLNPEMNYDKFHKKMFWGDTHIKKKKNIYIYINKLLKMQKVFGWDMS